MEFIQLVHQEFQRRLDAHKAGEGQLATASHCVTSPPVTTTPTTPSHVSIQPHPTQQQSVPQSVPQCVPQSVPLPAQTSKVHGTAQIRAIKQELESRHVNLRKVNPELAEHGDSNREETQQVTEDTEYYDDEGIYDNIELLEPVTKASK